MSEFAEDSRHVIGPLYLEVQPRDYQAPDLSNIEDYFFAPVIDLPWPINDCVTLAINSVLRFPAFTNR